MKKRPKTTHIPKKLTNPKNHPKPTPEKNSIGYFFQEKISGSKGFTPVSNFFDRLIELGFKTYNEYLNSDWWRSFKIKYKKSRRRKSCLLCTYPNYEIELHHITYKRLGCERLTDVVPLCREHHQLIHSLLNDRYYNNVEYTTKLVADLKAEDPDMENPPHAKRNGHQRKARWQRKGFTDESEPDSDHFTDLD